MVPEIPEASKAERGKRGWAVWRKKKEMLPKKCYKAAILTLWGHFCGPGFLEVPVRGSRCRKKQEEGRGKKKPKRRNLVVML